MRIIQLLFLTLLVACSSENKSDKTSNSQPKTHRIKDILELKIIFHLPDSVQKRGIHKGDCFYFDLEIPFSKFPELKFAEIVLESLDENVKIIPFNQTRFIFVVQPQIKNPIFGISVKLKPKENHIYIIEDRTIEFPKSLELFQRIYPIIE
jgi:hypothetical protein